MIFRLICTNYRNIYNNFIHLFFAGRPGPHYSFPSHMHKADHVFGQSYNAHVLRYFCSWGKWANWLWQYKNLLISYYQYLTIDIIQIKSNNTSCSKFMVWFLSKSNIRSMRPISWSRCTSKGIPQPHVCMIWDQFLFNFSYAMLSMHISHPDICSTLPLMRIIIAALSCLYSFIISSSRNLCGWWRRLVWNQNQTWRIILAWKASDRSDWLITFHFIYFGDNERKQNVNCNMNLLLI